MDLTCSFKINLNQYHSNLLLIESNWCYSMETLTLGLFFLGSMPLLWSHRHLYIVQQKVHAQHQWTIETFLCCNHQLLHLLPVNIYLDFSRIQNESNIFYCFTVMSIVRNSAPKLSTCSRTADRVSNARTIAPIFFACAHAAKPATPPPTTKIFAGGTFPAATNSILI